VFATDEFISIAHNSDGTGWEANYTTALHPCVNAVGMRNFVSMSNAYSQVELTGTVTRSYNYLQASTNLSDWTVVPRGDYPGYFLILQTNVTTKWLDPFTNNPSPRFYRSSMPRRPAFQISQSSTMSRRSGLWSRQKQQDQPTDRGFVRTRKYLPSKPICPSAARTI